MGSLLAFLEGDKAYFAHSKRSITAQNNRMLTDGCVVYMFVLLFYTILSTATKQPPLLRNLYYIFDVIHIVLCAAVYFRTEKGRASFKATQLYCCALECSVLSFFALEGALTTPDAHSLYVPIAILLLQLLFIHGTAYSLLSIFLYTFSFAVLSRIHKTPEAYTNDFYIAVATFISANIGYTLIARLRRNEQQALTKFENLSRTDALTGLLNKSTLEQMCQEIILEHDRECTMLMVDLDDFKSVNDLYGHDVGDEVLRCVGAAIRRVFRSGDVMGRFGGDEFVVLMDACVDREMIEERLSALRRLIAGQAFSVRDLSVRYSAGIAYKQENDDFRSMFARADAALYEAKGKKPPAADAQ